MSTLEEYEWTQTWHANTHDIAKPRALLIGDSISVGYRDEVNKVLDGRIIADTFSTSKALDNPFFLREITLFTEQTGATYEIVHVNNGLHGFHLSADAYKTLLKEFLCSLMAVYPHAVFQLALSTPVRDDDHPGQFGSNNSFSLERNEMARQVAAELHIEIDDLYTPASLHPQFGVGDGYHFTAEGYHFLGECVAASLLRAKHD